MVFFLYLSYVYSLTGITTSGTPHIGNYVGAIKPSIEQSKKFKNSFLFLADYHSLIKNQDPELTDKSSLEIAAVDSLWNRY